MQSQHILPVSVFVGRELLATFQHDFGSGEAGYVPHAWYSKALFCPECGDVWARFIVPGHMFYCGWSHCPRHGDIGLDSGSLVWNVAIVDFLNSLPAEVWNWELRRWAEQFDNWGELCPIINPINPELSHHV